MNGVCFTGFGWWFLYFILNCNNLGFCEIVGFLKLKFEVLFGWSRAEQV
jgi:hypothetical protein